MLPSRPDTRESKEKELSEGDFPVKVKAMVDVMFAVGQFGEGGVFNANW